MVTTISDTFNGGSADTLGTADILGTFTKDAGNSLDGFTSAYDKESQTYTFDYNRSVTVVAGTCTTYNNEADVDTVLQAIRAEAPLLERVEAKSV